MRVPFGSVDVGSLYRETLRVARRGAVASLVAVCATCTGQVIDPINIHILSVAGTGTGAGTVNSTAINCTINNGVASGSCSSEFDEGTNVTLSQTAQSGSIFTGFSGSCTNAATFTITKACPVIAGFRRTYALTVGGTGTGTGTIATQPTSTLACTITVGVTSGTCTASFADTVTATVIPTAAAGSSFISWTGSCTSAPCSLSMSTAKNVTANFRKLNALAVTGGGTGSGTVSGGGITCTVTNGTAGTTGCSANYIDSTNAAVTLTPAASTGSQFTGWSGACSGTSTCSVTMSAARNVTATFRKTFVLTVTGAGSGNGTITNSAYAFNCSITAGSASAGCTATFVDTASIPLAAAATSGTFTSWTGDCTGSTSCTAVMTANRNITATFTVVTFTLTVAADATMTSGGTVTSSTGGINCTTVALSSTTSGTCVASFTSGSTPTLTATPQASMKFVDWIGDCTGQTCAPTMTANRSVTPRFVKTLTSGVAETNLSAATGVDRFYHFNVASGTSLLTVAISGGTGDADLYVRQGALPTTSLYDCRPFLGGSSETCSINNPAAGDWYIDARGFSSYTGLSLTATAGTATQTLLISSDANATGSGSVTSSISGINCSIAALSTTPSGSCAASFSQGASVTVTPTASAGSKFGDWTGDCTGSGTCTVTMSAARSVTPRFVKTLTDGLTESVGSSAAKYFHFNVAPGTTSLTIATTGGTGDADLHVRQGSLPTTSLYDCRPFLGGNNETCSFNNPVSGDWYIMMNPFSTFSGVSLLATTSTLAFQAGFGTSSLTSAASVQLTGLNITGSNRLLICVVGLDNYASANTVNNILLDNGAGGGTQFMTQLGGYYNAISAGYKWSTWYLVAPTVSSGRRVIASLNSTSAFLTVSCVQYVGAHQTNPFANVTSSASGSSGTASLILSSDYDQSLAWGHLISTSVGFGTSTGSTSRQPSGTSLSAMVDGNTKIANFNSHTFNWFYSGQYAGQAVMIRPFFAP